jgi:DNA processing protein
MISIVGTRQITSYGTEFCRKLIEDLAPLDPVIVSGFAYGVDIVAHQFAMEYKIARGSCPWFKPIYPKPHKNMWPRWKRMAVL